MYRRHFIFRLKSKPPLHIAEGHSLGCVEKTMLPCTEKESASCTDSKGTLCAWCRKDAPSSLYREGVTLLYTRHREISPLYREDTSSSVQRWYQAPLLVAEGHSLLCVEYTLTPLHREGVCHPLCGEEGHTLIGREKEYVILAIWKRDTHSFATRRVSLLRL